MDGVATAASAAVCAVEPIWRGATVVCIATGDSLSADQCELIRHWRERGGCRVIAINDAYLWAPWADVLYFADTRWWKWNNDGIDRKEIGLSAAEVKERFRGFAGQKISIANVGTRVDDPSVLVLRNANDEKGTSGRLSTDPTGIYTGQNSGYQAINVAVLYGASRIVLIGYDMKVSSRGKHHFFGEHPLKSDPISYRQFASEFKRMAPTAKAMGVEILNATPDSELEGFDKVSLEALI